MLLSWFVLISASQCVLGMPFDYLIRGFFRASTKDHKYAERFLFMFMLMMLSFRPLNPISH